MTPGLSTLILYPYTLSFIPYTVCQVIIKYYSGLNFLKEKSAKVQSIKTDKKVEGKITVEKGGG